MSRIREAQHFFPRGLIVLISLLAFIFNCYSQSEPIQFKRHRFRQNILSGQELKFEFPVNLGYIMVSDRYGNSEQDSKTRVYLNGGVCVGLKNPSGYGFSTGIAAEYSNLGYMSYNAMLNLDYFGAIMTENGKKKFGVFMFNRWALNMIKGTSVEGEKIQEYYLRLNMLYFCVRGFNFHMSLNKGVFRKKYPAEYANSGLLFNLGYTFE